MRCFFDSCGSWVSADLSGPGKRLWWLESCGMRALVERLSLCCVDGLMLDPMCDTPHVQVTIVALQWSSKVAESV